MKQNLVIYNLLYLILLSILFVFFILSCDLKKTNNYNSVTPDGSKIANKDDADIDLNTNGQKNNKKQIQEKRPYNFKIIVKAESNNKSKIRTIDENHYSYDDNYFQIKEENNEISFDLFENQSNELEYNLFKVKQDEIENFKKAMLNDGSFKCSINQKTGNKNQNAEYKTNSEDMNVIKKNNYIFLDFPNIKNTTSFAVPLSELKKHITLN